MLMGPLPPLTKKGAIKIRQGEKREGERRERERASQR
jgi:hypothetical protein